MKRTAIFGGTFNPIHNGHMNLMRELDQKLQFDRILLIPSNLPPHKPAEDLASGADRLEMCRLAVREFPQVEISVIELQRPGRSYTVDTLHALQKQYPNEEFTLLLGGDMFRTFSQWYSYREILSMARLAVAARSQKEHQLLIEEKKQHPEYGNQVELCEVPVFEVSSTEIRQALREDRLKDGLLDSAVLHYIRTHHLYQSEEE